MQNENNQVEIVYEPKIDSRFGFQKPKNRPSNRTIKICIIATCLLLGTVLWIKTPDRAEGPSDGITPPEASEVGAKASQQVSIEGYSAEQESNQLKEKGKKRTSKISIKLPGSQKIDRKQAGKIPPGSQVKARLITGASNGFIRAETLESLQIRGETFIKAGETLVGQGQSTEDRLFIRFSSIVHGDGSTETVQAQAVDAEDKTAGLKGPQFSRYAMKYGAAVGLNFVGGMAEVLQDKTAVGTQTVASPTAKNALLNGASRAALEMANDTMTNIHNQPPPIAIEAGQEIMVIFD